MKINITKNDLNLLKSKYKNINRVLKKIDRGYPIQYLIGDVNFFGYKILVNKKVFIPRMETELLVEKTINKIKNLKIEDKSIADICSGSGCIAITLSKELNKNVDAIEKSKKAIKVANKSNTLNKSKVNFIHKNILKEKKINYDIVISNPPYVKTNSKVDIQTKFEPQIALYSPKDDLQFYRHILSIVNKDVLLICFEIGYDQANDISKLINEKLPNHNYSIEKDYTGKERFIFIWKTNE